MAKVNMKMLAKSLDLSIGTVSKAMKDSYEISEATKKRVFAMAEKMNYKPNPYAGSLKGGGSKTIGVVIPEVNNSFFSQALNGVESITREKGYHMLIYLTHDSFHYEQTMLKDFQSGRVDGVIISVASETSSSGHIKELQNSGIPVVFFDRVCEDIKTAKMTTDDFVSCYNATKHLIENGCRKIQLLAISKHLSISRERMDGYKKALKDHGIRFEERDVIYCGNNESANYEIIKKTLDVKNRSGGLIAMVEELIGPAYKACDDLGLLIPKDIKIISFTNHQMVSFLNPPLTTITQPAFELGKAAASVLCKALRFQNFDLGKESLVFNSSLAIRESSVLINVR